MALHAVQNIGTAFTVTREYLLPFDIRTWLKLAVVVFFIGGGIKFPTAQFNTSGVPDQVPENGISVSVSADVMTIIVVSVVFALALGLVFGIIGSIMEFVFIEALRNREVSIRRDWSVRWRQGLRLFGFRILIGPPVLAVFLGWMAVFFVPIFMGAVEPLIPISLFLLGIPLLFVIGLVFELVSAFTTVFVVPIMIKNDTGVLAAWRLLWPSIKAEWKEYLAYAIAAFVLTFAMGLLRSIVLGLTAIILLIPLATIAVITHLSVSLSSTIGVIVVAFLVLLFVATLILLWALAQVPVLTYPRYFALLMLEDIESSFDIIPEQREALHE